MRKFIFTIMLLVGISPAFGQCPGGSNFFTTQQSIDDFPVNYPSCTALGSVNINGADITDLSGLSNITQINGTLHIYNSPMLETLDGLQNITTITSTLWINNNEALQDLNGLNGLETIGAILNVSNNSSLSSIAGLSSLTAIGGNFDLRFNPMLTSLNGLNNLGSIGGNLTLEGAGIASITALSGLTSINGEIDIANTALSSLSGLDNIDPSGITNLDIQRSGGLSTCHIASVCNYLSNEANSATFAFNDTGCNTRMEVTTFCETLPVELAAFGYHLADGSVVLEWITSSELNNLGFDVEYAKDGLHWEKIGFVEGYGTTADTHRYEFAHKEFVGGTNYYRLKQMDFDGSYVYSDIVSVSLSSQWKGKEWVVYPNPTSGYVTVNGDMSNLPTVRITTSTGMMVREFELNQPQIDISDLPGGLYTFTFNNGRDMITRRVIKSVR